MLLKVFSSNSYPRCSAIATRKKSFSGLTIWLWQSSKRTARAHAIKSKQFSKTVSKTSINTALTIQSIDFRICLCNTQNVLTLDAFLLHILPDENRDRVFAFLTALMTATVPIGTGMFSVYINLAKTSYIFCVIGVVIVIFACMYGIIDRNK